MKEEEETTLEKHLVTMRILAGVAVGIGVLAGYILLMAWAIDKFGWPGGLIIIPLIYFIAYNIINAD